METKAVINKADTELGRLQKVLLTDNLRIPSSVLEMMKAELAAVISNYLDVIDGTVEMVLQPNNDSYLVVFSVYANSAKAPKTI